MKPESKQREVLIHDELEANTLRRGIRFDELALIDAHRLALDWFIYEDEMELQVSDFNLKQRYILALLAFEFGAMFRTNNVDWLSSKSECSWDWITCNGKLQVTGLEL